MGQLSAYGASPTLLIVVPTLDSHALLPKLVGSLQAQTWPNWRLLFVDGPSGPAHRAVLNHLCACDARCHWIPEDGPESGIFGAMNHGFIAAEPSDWLLFWGSDDWAASPTVLADAMTTLQQATTRASHADLLVCRGRYIDPHTLQPGRPSCFGPRAAVLSARAYRRALLSGSTPPHQATLIGPGARTHLAHYAAGFRLSADLDYFLQLSRASTLRVQTAPIELVHMGTGGVSGQQTRRRLQEVRRAYHRAFGWAWWFPFSMRYLLRLASLLTHRLTSPTSVLSLPQCCR